MHIGRLKLHSKPNVCARSCSFSCSRRATSSEVDTSSQSSLSKMRSGLVMSGLLHRHFRSTDLEIGLTQVT